MAVLEQNTDYAEALYAYLKRHQRMPTYRELLKIWRYKTKSAVDYRVKKLVAANLIGKEGRRLMPKKH